MKEKWHLNLKDLFAVRSEAYIWLHVDPASQWAKFLYDGGIMPLNKHLKDQVRASKHQRCRRGVTQMSKYLAGPLDLRSGCTNSQINSVLCNK